MNYSEALNYLYSLGNEVLTAKLGLRNIEVLLQQLGDPHKRFSSILIAGTNGKGSVAAYCDSVLRASGYKTGLYTSPHLIQIEERIRVDGMMIPADEFACLTNQVKNAVTILMRELALKKGLHLESHPTYFEMVTAIAFKYFAEQQIEIAVLEVGLGGRLDATNAVDPVVAVITNVDLDHQQYLGNSLLEITAEKAGIIKGRCRNKDQVAQPDSLPVVFAGVDGPVLELIRERCRVVGATLFRLPENSDYVAEADQSGRFKLRLDSQLGKAIDIRLPLAGEHQVSNALTAIRTMELLAGFGYRIDRHALGVGISRTEWPGRLEILDFRPRMVLDGAHNPAAAARVKDFVETFLQRKKIVMVFAAMKDKAIGEMGRVLFPLAREIVLTQTGSQRSAQPSEILNLISDLESPIHSVPSVREAIDIAEQLASQDDTIVFVGSLFLVGEVKEILRQRR